MCIAVIFYLVRDVKNFEINLSILIKQFFYKTITARTKTQIFRQGKELLTFNMN